MRWGPRGFWMGNCDLVGVTEIALRANVKPDTVLKWRKRHADFPQPTLLAAGPVWEMSAVTEWLAKPRPAGRRMK
jgi:hypothetical protein